MDIKTICIHGGDWKDATGCISVPVFQSATFGHPELGQSTGYDYTRVQNPTRESTEKLVAALEHCCDCTSYSSGMAAMSIHPIWMMWKKPSMKRSRLSISKPRPTR